MDVIERMDKARKLGNVFYLYLVFSIVNVLIHIANYYNGFLNASYLGDGKYSISKEEKGNVIRIVIDKDGNEISREEE